MNLAVDIGNTFIKLGFFENDVLLFAEKKNSLDEAFSLVAEHAPKNIIFSSVSKDPAHFISRLNFDPHIVLLDHETPVPVNILYETPKTLGLDRLSAVVGAQSIYPNKNVLVIDAGTCVTYDFIDKESNYYGGSISPGLNLRFKSLYDYTSKLPLIQFQDFDRFYGKNTKEAILSGVINGLSGEIESFIHRYLSEYQDLEVIITGGDANFFETKIKQPIFAVPNLVLIGLDRILKHNVL